MGLTVYTIDKLAIDVKTCAERGLALVDGCTELVREGGRHCNGDGNEVEVEWEER